MSTMAVPMSAAPSVTSFAFSTTSSVEKELQNLSNLPPSTSPGDPFRPSIELSKPVYEIDPRNPICTVTGEIELDTSLFAGMGAYSIGIAFSSSDNAFTPEWNQDPTHTAYHRARSYIHMSQRLIVDDTCYLKFRIDVPPSALPGGKAGSRVYNVDVRCYALGRPEVATKPSSVQFMILNRSGRMGTGGRRTSVAA